MWPPTTRPGLFDLGELAVDRDNDEFAGAFLIDAAHVLVTGRIYLPGRPVCGPSLAVRRG